MDTLENSKCYVVGERVKPHTPYVGVFNGLPRTHCSRCGQWLEPPRKEEWTPDYNRIDLTEFATDILKGDAEWFERIAQREIDCEKSKTKQD